MNTLRICFVEFYPVLGKWVATIQQSVAVAGNAADTRVVVRNYPIGAGPSGQNTAYSWLVNDIQKKQNGGQLPELDPSHVFVQLQNTTGLWQHADSTIFRATSILRALARSKFKGVEAVWEAAHFMAHLREEQSALAEMAAAPESSYDRDTRRAVRKLLAVAEASFGYQDALNLTQMSNTSTDAALKRAGVLSTHPPFVIGGVYRHYKKLTLLGTPYEVTVLGLAFDKENPKESRVFYRSHETNCNWFTTPENFQEAVEHGGHVVPRYRRVAG